MVGNALILHRTIDDDLLKRLNVEVENTQLLYTEEEGGEKQLTLKKDDESTLFMGEVQELWDPNTNDLHIKRTLTINNPRVLFAEGGVAPKDSILGLACHIYSKSSGFQMTRDLNAELHSNSEENMKIELNHTFLPATIKGEVYFNIFIYSRETKNNGIGFANKKGMDLGIIDEFQVVVDGDGSIFPIIEVSRPGEPLWKLVMKWSDITADPFDIEYVRVEINKNHSMYDYLFKDTRPSIFLLYEILSNVMSQVIYKGVNDPDFEEELIDSESISSVISYWIKTYELDISSLESINYGLRNKLEEVMIK